MRKFSPTRGDRCAPAGWWPTGVTWANGEVEIAGVSMINVRANTGLVLSLAFSRFTWKESAGEWAVWSTEVDAHVQSVLKDEAKADKSWKVRSGLPSPGAYIRVEMGGRRVNAFAFDTTSQGVMCVFPSSEMSFAPRAGVKKWFLTPSMLRWDEIAGHWTARYGREARI